MVAISSGAGCPRRTSRRPRGISQPSNDRRRTGPRQSPPRCRSGSPPHRTSPSCRATMAETVHHYRPMIRPGPTARPGSRPRVTPFRTLRWPLAPGGRSTLSEEPGQLLPAAGIVAIRLDRRSGRRRLWVGIRRLLVQSGVNGFRRHPADALDPGDLLDVRLAQGRQRAEVLDQSGSSRLTEPADPVQRRLRHRLRPFGPVVGDGEAMRLVAESLQQVEGFAGPGEDDRVVLARDPDLLQALRQTAHRHIGDLQVGEHRGRSIDLGSTAVDHQ